MFVHRRRQACGGVLVAAVIVVALLVRNPGSLTAGDGAHAVAGDEVRALRTENAGLRERVARIEASPLGRGGGVKGLRWIYVVTPTYRRPTQKVLRFRRPEHRLQRASVVRTWLKKRSERGTQRPCAVSDSCMCLQADLVRMAQCLERVPNVRAPCGVAAAVATCGPCALLHP